LQIWFGSLVTRGIISVARLEVILEKMIRTAFVITPVLSVLFSLGATAQEPVPPPPSPAVKATPQAAGGPAPCPKIMVQSPAGRNVREGQPVIFAANIAGGDQNVSPQILWTVSNGVIKDGQQTLKIEVDSTGAGNTREITADLWIGGYSGECQSQASATVKVIPPASKADEFGELDAAKENEHLAAAAAAMSQSDDNLYIIAYAGRTSPRGHATAALRRMRTQLTTLGLNSSRVGVLDGGFRENAEYEIWVFPQGAELPKATPTVDRKEIVYPKATPGPARKPAKP
jgi:hypothetical protein